MKTPYDAALRILRLEMDALRGTIGTAAARLMAIETSHRAMNEAIRHEGSLVADPAMLPSAVPAHLYLERARAERARLAGDEQAAATQLQGLRRRATERYGSLRAIEGATDAYRADADRAAAVAEQSRIDDFTGARLGRRLCIAAASRRSATR